MRHVALACFLASLVALAGCGRTELDFPEDVPHPDVPARDAADVPTDGGCVTNAECDDGVFCNGPELCVAGACQPSMPVNCDDGVACTQDQCNEPTRMCLHVPDAMRCPAGQTCDVMMGCTSGGCTSDAMCTDGDPCDGVEVCRAGRCVRTPPPSCDDGVPCTDDACVPMRGCTNTPNDRRCDDGVFCDGAERCSTAARGCVASPPVNCNDGNACTQDLCSEPMRACVHPPTDMDGDGFPPVACRGTDCNDLDPRVNPGATEVCNDGRDNNCDGRSDCADPFCAMNPVCASCVPTGPENSAAACHDGRDDDCNGSTDCADPRCAPFCGCVPTGPENTAAACSDGRDEDCDGFVDCMDPDCAAVATCCVAIPENNPMTCTDGRDDDCDGAVDCADPDCRLVPACAMCVRTGPENDPASCSDGRDDDCDGSIDCADPGCAMVPACGRPVNDTCATPTRITVPGSASGSTARATDNYGASCAPSSPAPDVVYVFDNPVTQTITIDTFGSSYDTVLYVRRATCDAGPDVACDDDSPMGGLQSTVTLPSAPPGRYFVIVDGWGSSSGAYQLHITVPGREICNNGVDDDGDGAIDCADSDCATDPACVMCVPTGPENTDAACSDGRDNDCNGVADCLDRACLRFPRCTMCVPTGPENNNAACSDGRDNDCNGAVDCADPGCRGVPVCPVCVPTGPETTFVACSDGRDNDCDGRVDCADSDCARFSFCSMCRPTGPENTVSACMDGADNDCDGRVDCADPECSGVGTCACVAVPENTDAACSDGRDNDCDRFVDCADPDCRATAPCMTCVPTGPENTATACADGRDNDCDMLVDCMDPGCATTPACMVCRPTGPENTDAACSDGRDDDCDGAVDCMDTGCAATAPCTAVPDTCATAARIGLPGSASGSTTRAHDDFAARCATSTPAPDVVYFFDNPTTQTVTVDTLGSAFDTVLTVRSGSCTSGSDVACDDDSGGSTASLVTLNALPPGRYWIFVDGWTNSSGTYQLHVRLGAAGMEICTNGVDDDGDGLIDCADPDCATNPACMVCMPTGPENNPMACADGRDDDCNGVTDCADPGCARFPMCCTPTGPENTMAACTNGRDDDCDGATDCADPGCAMVPACCRGRMEVCGNGVDDNCNGLTDCADPACAMDPACATCVPTAMSESGPAACSNGIDDDCDGQADCSDPDCQPFPGPMSECCNGRDDNGNGAIDEFACTCTTNAQCASIGAGGRFPSNTCYASTLSVCGPACNTLGGDIFCNGLLPGSHCNTTTGQCM